MNNAIRRGVHIALGLALGAVLTACGSGSGGNAGPASSSAPAGSSSDQYGFMGSPTMRVTRKPAANPHPAASGPLALKAWRASAPEAHGSFAYDPAGGPHGTGAFVLTGDGSSPAREVFSQPVAVKPGKTYTFSAWVDGSNVTSGWTYLWVSSASRNRIYAKAQLPPKQAGLYSFKVPIPKNVSKVVFGYYTAGCHLAKDQKIVFADPAFAAM